jgi:hypothetical protein
LRHTTVRIVQRGPLFRQSDPVADFFFYSGQVYFAGGCCGSFSVLGLSGTWQFDFDPDIPPLPGQGAPLPSTDYTGLVPPPDIPEPSTLTLLGIGGCILVLRLGKARRRLT